MIKKPIVLAQILLISFILSLVSKNTDVVQAYPISSAIAIALLSIGSIMVAGILRDRLKSPQSCYSDNKED
ncbi:hypothetical protein [Dongshaea marina]|uniref:hypothetical protein n=1 Tax=Dongshaea marina TaxID=2047966 RepID=UPI000D3E51B4|nr:hypothetical protein [Dongshaea marina]